MADPKDLPSSEYSLKGISWQVKVIADQLTKLNQNLERLIDSRSPGNHAPF